MSRAELRRQQKAAAKNEKVYHLTAAQMITLKKQITDEAVRKIKEENDKEKADLGVEAFCWVLGISLKVLHEKYGFGTKRLGDFAEYACSEFNSGSMTLKEIQDYIFEKTEIKVVAK